MDFSEVRNLVFVILDSKTWSPSTLENCLNSAPNENKSAEILQISSNIIKFYTKNESKMSSYMRYLTETDDRWHNINLLSRLKLISEQKVHIIDWFYKCIVISEDGDTMCWSGFKIKKKPLNNNHQWVITTAP